MLNRLRYPILDWRFLIQRNESDYRSYRKEPMEIAQEIEKTYKEVKMKGHLFEKKERFSIRKFSVGVCSALIGLAFLGTGAVSADEAVSTL